MIAQPINSTSSNVITAIAGENISGGKAVIINTDGLVHVYDITNEAHYGLSVGIAKTAATTGNTIDVFINGIVTEGGSGWLAGIKYYVSSTGILSNTPPVSGLTKLVGVGTANDKILITNVFELITI